MMNDPVYNHLRELSWRRRLAAREEAELRTWLAAHPEAQAEWEAEAGLNDALGLLSDAPLGSNFTARVLRAVQLEAAASVRRRRRLQIIWWARLAARPGLAVIVAAAGFFSYQQFYRA